MEIRNTQPHLEKVPYPIIRPRPHCSVHFASRSKALFGLDTHYGSGGTFACPGYELCKECQKGRVPRYQGYLFGLGADTNVTAIIHLTASAAIWLAELDSGRDGLLGLRLILNREGESDNGEVTVKTFGRKPDIEELAAQKLSDAVHVIYRMRKKGWKPQFVDK